MPFLTLRILILGALLILTHPVNGFLTSARSARVGLRTKGYKTEPDFKPQLFQVDYLNNGKSSLSPGYIFVAMMWELGAPFGPQIYSSDGELVWYGSVLPNRVQDFKLCTYQRPDNDLHEFPLCWSEREKVEGSIKPIVHKVFMASNYTLVRNITLRSDLHETMLTDGGKSLLTMDYTWTDMDLTPYLGPKNGRFKDACIIEYDLATAKSFFEWCYSNHFPLWETKIFPHQSPQVNQTSNIAGKGSQERPWDPIHMNAVDKNLDGDYIGSFRHLNQIMKIAGPYSLSGKEPGTVLWRLGGFGNQFDTDFNFSMQHDVKYVKSDAEGDVISLFDNAWEGINEPSATHSAGKIIRVDNATMKARLLREYPHPEGILSRSRGSMQILDNGNAFVGWGALAEMTEFTEDATPLYHAKFDSRDSKQFSYRTYKYSWAGIPSWPPKLVAYTYSCVEDRKPLYAYVSWNGVTLAKHWRLFTSFSQQGPWLYAGSYNKTGFETRIKLDKPVPYVSVEALDENGHVLSAVTRKTFVPHLGLKSRCDEYGCQDHFVYNEDASRAEKCKKALSPALVPFVMMLLLIELFVRAEQSILHICITRENSLYLI